MRTAPTTFGVWRLVRTGRSLDLFSLQVRESVFAQLGLAFDLQTAG